ncbi:ABC transporter substrate-binding protein [Pectinatus cerevisiiphilus]|uniref:Iron complex transport system substrate-binding protein n=1 Tax=Pectinatus cerevisiiphilus TaxID=86956 RepID=A0A4R3KDZ1_9FIRM|nr:ABC transporter substrate-binding protein [Pectinatus cerevisiiphilus]TCS81398.1 iron complex transport system substrate-binding protein [Pectinatus cerevisiiphilus]
MGQIQKTRKIFYILAVITICSFFIAGCAPKTAPEKSAQSAYSVVDSHGTKVDFAKKPQKVITLSMSTDEIVLGLVKPDKLIAVNYLLDDPVSSNIPELAQQIPTKIKDPSAEEIFAMKPDLVIIPDWNNIEIADNLRDLGLNVVIVPGAKNIDEVKTSIQLIADSLGEHEKGTALIALMDNKISEIQDKVAKIPQADRKKVVILSLMPGYGGIGSSFDDLCKYAGVTNGMAEAGLQNGQAISKEELVKINPDVLFLPSYTDHDSIDAKARDEKYLDDPALQVINAVKNNQLIYPREGYLYSVSQNIVFGIQEIDRCVYGSDFDFPDKTHLSVAE